MKDLGYDVFAQTPDPDGRGMKQEFIGMFRTLKQAIVSAEELADWYEKKEVWPYTVDVQDNRTGEYVAGYQS